MTLNYFQTRSELYDLQKFAIKLGLDNITALAAYLGDPQKSYPVIHIAGTNGKGSTARIMHQIFQEHGLRCGLFTSPHLYDFRERIRINDQLITEEGVIDFWQSIRETVLKRKATFFDTTTAMAMYWFKQQNVDVAIFETGLGGRLDSTNIVQPHSVVITPIARDHEKQLGSDLKQIAVEKAGIIKSGVCFYSAKQISEVRELLQNKLHEEKSQWWFGDSVTYEITNESPFSSDFHFQFKGHPAFHKDYKLNLPGAFQVENAILALKCAAGFLESRDITPKVELERKALENVEWPGRLQCVGENPWVYFDVSHNTAGISETAAFIARHFEKKDVHLLIGLLRDKDIADICNMLIPITSSVTVTEPKNERLLRADDLAGYFKKSEIRVTVIKDIAKAFDFSIKQLTKQQTLLVTGSHFLIADLQHVQMKKHLT